MRFPDYDPSICITHIEERERFLRDKKNASKGCSVRGRDSEGTWPLRRTHGAAALRAKARSTLARRSGRSQGWSTFEVVAALGPSEHHLRGPSDSAAAGARPCGGVPCGSPLRKPVPPGEYIRQTAWLVGTSPFGVLPLASSRGWTEGRMAVHRTANLRYVAYKGIVKRQYLERMPNRVR